MTSLIRFLALTTLPFVISCATPQQRTLAFSLQEESYGIYEVRGEQNVFLDATEEIACELGLSFGVEMTFDVRSETGGLVPLGGEWRTPPVEGLRPAVTNVVPNPPLVPSGAVSASFLVGYTFDERAEMVSGSYFLRFYNLETDETLHSRDFRVAECP